MGEVVCCFYLGTWRATRVRTTCYYNTNTFNQHCNHVGIPDPHQTAAANNRKLNTAAKHPSRGRNKQKRHHQRICSTPTYPLPPTTDQASGWTQHIDIKLLAIAAPGHFIFPRHNIHGARPIRKLRIWNCRALTQSDSEIQGVEFLGTH